MQRARSIPIVFQDQIYKYGSFGNPDAAIRELALQHILDSIEIARRLGSRDISCGSPTDRIIPAPQNIRHRRRWFEEDLKAAHAAMTPGQRMLVEYKPFEPAFYHTDIADWGMALLLSRLPGRRRKCWSIPAITIRRRTSSRSSPGCSI